MLLKGLFRGTVVACLLAGVVWVSSGFAVVSGANVAKSGGVCGKAGARVVSQSVSLVCKKMVSGKLVWRVVKASTTSTTTTTTVGPTTASAPKVAVVAPRVVSASSATGNAVITIADMSPDTGVYAVQWVPSGQDFNSYQMYRTTTKTMTVPYLSCTRTYTLRVFVMQENWQMSDGFVNQNVTPHSATFDLTMPACTAAARATAAAATTTTVALTCATGGTCIVGDTGPGGGLVFYVHASGTFTCGATLASTCKYLEAAPNTWSGGSADPTKLWAISTYQSSDIATITNDSSAYNNALGIGLGYKNSLAIVNQGNDTTTAAGAARAYNGGSQSDWYLPTTAELNLLCQWARNVVQSVTTPCTGGSLNTGTGASGGFSSATYWSSSEHGARIAWYQIFGGGVQFFNFKNDALYVRPVRAFG